MRHTLLFFTLICLLFSCNSDSSTNTDTTNQDSTNTAVTTPTQTEPATAQDALGELRGVYVKGGHNSAWMLTLRTVDGATESVLIKFNGMIPPVDFLMSDENEVEADYQILESIKIDIQANTFSSNLGTATINAAQIVFADVKDELGDPLTLDRDDNYAPLLDTE